jgi:hypothetical protein
LIPGQTTWNFVDKMAPWQVLLHVFMFLHHFHCTTELSGGQSGTVTGFSLGTSVFPLQNHYTNGISGGWSAIGTGFLQVPQFSHLSIIPPMFHSHPSIYH